MNRHLRTCDECKAEFLPDNDWDYLCEPCEIQARIESRVEMVQLNIDLGYYDEDWDDDDKYAAEHYRERIEADLRRARQPL